MSHTIGEARSVPQNALEQLFGSTAKDATAIRKFLNENFGLPFVDTGLGLGNMIMGQGPEMLEDMSWGKSPILPSGHGFRIDPRIMDIAGIAAPIGMLGKKFAKEGLKDLFTKHPQKQLQGGYIVRPGHESFDQGRGIVATSMDELGASEDDIWKETKTWLGHGDKDPR